MYCKNCGNKLDDDAIFCSKCGVRKETEGNAFYCEKCGTKISDDDVFCTKCGSRIIGEKTQTNTQADTKIKNQAESENVAVPVIDEKQQEEKTGTETNLKTENVKNESIKEANDCNGEDKSESKNMDEKNTTNAIKNRKQNKKSYRLLFGVIFGIVVIFTGLYFGTNQKNPWTGSDFGLPIFNLDIINAKVENFVNNDGKVELINCYKISNANFEKLWNSIPNVSIVYGGMNWYPFNPEYHNIEDYNSTLEQSMQRYDIIVTQIYHYDERGSFFWAYLINRRTGQVMKF